MKLNKILIGTGETQYGVLNTFAVQLAECFHKKGIEVDIMDMNDSSSYPYYISSNYDLLFSFNAMFAEYFLSQISCKKNIPIWSFLVDHPIHLDNELLQYRRYHIVSCVDRNHLDFVKEFYPHNQWSCFLPHGGTSYYIAASPHNTTNDITILGSLPVEVQHEFDNKFTQLSSSMQAIITDVVSKLFYNHDICFETTLQQSFSSYGLVVNQEEFRLLLNELCYVDTYVRFRKRLAIVEALINHNLTVHVYGTGWNCLQASNNLIIHDSVEYAEALEIIGQSRIVINIMPLFADGSHERIFDTMLQRTLCFTDRSLFLEENFEDEKEIFFYSMNNLDQLANRIDNVLAGKYDEQTIIERAYQKASNLHTWNKRAEFIIEYLNNIDIPQLCNTQYNNTIDYEFYETGAFFSSISSTILYNKMKGSYFFKNKLIPDFTESLSHSYNTYKFWGTWNPEDNDFGVIENRILHLKEHWTDFANLYSKLSDHVSKKVLLHILKYWETMDSYYLETIQDTIFNHYFDLDIIQISEDEVFVDLGAYTGDTLCSYINTFFSTYKTIYCYECSDENATQLESLAQSFPNVIVRKCAVGSHCGYVSLDSNCRDSSSDRICFNETGTIPMVSLDEDIREKITFIKADIEGAEYSAIEGARNHILKDHPKMAISVYHGNEDLWKLPKLIHEIDPSYRFYLRYYGGNLYPNEIVLYAI